MTPIQILFLAGLGGAWLALVFPLAIRGRSASVHGSAAGFEQAMAVLRRDSELTMTTSAASDRRKQSTRARGRDAARVVRAAEDSLALMRRLLVGSLLGVAASAAAAISWGGVFWTIFVVATIATGGYVTVLRHRKLEADRAKAVIRSIRTDPRSFVGREDPHLYETLPSTMEGLADERHFAGAPARRDAGRAVREAAPGHAPPGRRASTVEVL